MVEMHGCVRHMVHGPCSDVTMNSIYRVHKIYHKIFTIGATTHVECLHDNYDVIDYMATMLEKRRNVGTLYLQNCTKGKIETWHMASTPHGE